MESFLGMSIDEFSHKIGSLEAKQESLEKIVQSNHEVANKKLDKIIDKLTDINGSVKDAHHRIDTAEKEMVTKKGALKFIIGGGLLSGAGGSGILQGIKTFLGMT